MRPDFLKKKRVNFSDRSRKKGEFQRNKYSLVPCSEPTDGLALDLTGFQTRPMWNLWVYKKTKTRLAAESRRVLPKLCLHPDMHLDDRSFDPENFKRRLISGRRTWWSSNPYHGPGRGAWLVAAGGGALTPWMEKPHAERALEWQCCKSNHTLQDSCRVRDLWTRLSALVSDLHVNGMCQGSLSGSFMNTNN